MATAGPVMEPELVADEILRALAEGDLRKLEALLDGMRRLPRADERNSPDSAEQRDLLEAAADGLRASMRRFGQQLTPALEGTEVPLQLLRHLLVSSQKPRGKKKGARHHRG